MRAHAILAVSLAWALLPRSFALGAEPVRWQLVKGRHFLVHYLGDPEFARRTARVAEELYEAIMRDLDFRKADDFWAWDKRARIYLYPSREAFSAALKAPGWAVGRASYEDRRIAGTAGEPFLDTVLPHEIMHLVFHEFLGFEGEAPQWLHEGLAQRSNARRQEAAKARVRRLARADKLIPLADLARLDVRKVTETPVALAFYAQAAGLVSYLIDEHGARRFRTLCGHLRGGKTLDDALRFTYPGTVRNMKELERSWREHVEDGR